MLHLRCFYDTMLNIYKDLDGLILNDRSKLSILKPMNWKEEFMMFLYRFPVER